jgi:glyceraldehyde-3-phosphate dehydrogenase (NADP+)
VYNLVYLPEVCFLIKIWYGFETACNQEEVNKVMELAKSAQKTWAKTPLWKRAELLHKAAAILKEHKAPIAECLIKEIAKPAKDSVTEVYN